MDAVDPTLASLLAVDTQWDRLQRDEMFLAIAKVVSLRGTCRRAQVGAVIVKENRIISTGYNGSAPGMPHCYEDGCLEDVNGGCTRTVHAEANSILWAARFGVSVEDSVMYSTHSPCLYCAKMIVGAGIVKVTYLHPYRDPAGLDYMHNCGLRYCHLQVG
jgi:dCMP deaminase